MKSLCDSGRASRFAPSAPAAPVLMQVMKEASITPCGMPVAESNIMRTPVNTGKPFAALPGKLLSILRPCTFSPNTQPDFISITPCGSSKSYEMSGQTAVCPSDLSRYTSRTPSIVLFMSSTFSMSARLRNIIFINLRLLLSF